MYLLLTFFEVVKWGKSCCRCVCVRTVCHHKKVFQFSQQIPSDSDDFIPLKMFANELILRSHRLKQAKIHKIWDPRGNCFRKHKKDFPILLLVDVKIMRPSPHQIRYRKICLFFFSWGVWHARVGFFLLFTWWSIDLCFRFSSSASTCFSHAVGSDGWNVFPVKGDIVFFLYLCSHFLAAFYPRLVQQWDEKRLSKRKTVKTTVWWLSWCIVRRSLRKALIWCLLRICK